MKIKFHKDGEIPPKHEIFVFGSNMNGAHYGGAAREAHQNYGALWGVFSGRAGNSYAIPTMCMQMQPLTVSEIKIFVGGFIKYAKSLPHQQFFVTRIGCGIAGHNDQDIAGLFAGAPDNCSLPNVWRPFFPENGNQSLNSF